MIALTSEEKIALLLTILGPECADQAMESLNPTQAKFVDRLMKDYQQTPPTEEEATYVIEDFKSYFQFALDTFADEIEQGSSEENSAEREPEPAPPPAAAPANPNAVQYFPKIELSEDSIADLNRLDPYQIAVALDGEHPKTVALLLSKLLPEKAANVLNDIDEDTRIQSVVFLTEDLTIPEVIANKMFRTIAERATSVEFRAPTLDRVAVVAEMMRSVDKKMRTALMEKLQESDESFCANVKKQLYVFEDLNRLGDRDVQKFLGEIQTEFLIIGLQKAPEDLKTKVLSNLSSRARQSVEEEMEFKTDCKQEEIDDARAQLIEVLARLDDAGEVSLE